MTLADAPTGTPLFLVSVGAAPAVTRRLATLGLRPGAPLRVMQRTSGGGRLVAVAGSRVALGRDMAAQVEVTEP